MQCGLVKTVFCSQHYVQGPSSENLNIIYSPCIVYADKTISSFYASYLLLS